MTIGADKKIPIKEIPEGWLQDGLRVVKEFIRVFNQDRVDNNQLRGFQHFELIFTAAGTRSVDHNIGEIPTDLVQTFATVGMTVTWNYANFTKDVISVTVSGPGTVRAYVGVHKDGIPL